MSDTEVQAILRAKSKLESLGYRLVILCGQRFEEEPATVGSGRHVGAHWVRGHWRNQAHGAGRTLRKLIWIMPYLVPGDGDETPPPGHLYLAT